MALRGLFITFEGGEGCGKTTQIQKLADHIKSIITVPFVVTREPGGVPEAELIRRILVNGDAETWRPATEGLLMSAARHEHVEQIIRPALVQNKLVISDRFVDSTIVYQGIVGGVWLVASPHESFHAVTYILMLRLLDIETDQPALTARRRGRPI